MSKNERVKMSADAEDRFEQHLEGDDFGDLDDWATQLGLEILKIESKLDANKGKNVAVRTMLKRRLAVYNAALEIIENNPKIALTLGGVNGGGVKAVINYLTKKAKEKAADDEMSTAIAKVKKYLPGVKLRNEMQALGGFRANPAAQAQAEADAAAAEAAENA